MRGVLLKVVSVMRGCLALLATERPHVGDLERIARGALLLPLFGVLMVLLRLGARLGVPLQVEATTRSGPRFACRLPDMIQTYLYLFGVWEPDITVFIRRRLSPGRTFVDVGANIGYHSILAASAVGDRGGVVAIEASPGIFRMLGESLDRNGRPGNVRAVNRAASEAPGTARVYLGPAHNLGLTATVRSRKSRRFDHEADVEAAPLADLLKPAETASARLVKIDVEGAEEHVLAGLRSFLETCPADVEFVVELSPLWWGSRERTPQQVLQPLFDAGFKAYRIDNDLWPWRYLWPNDVRPARRIRGRLPGRVKRLDLVLSREDRDTL